MNIKAGKVIIRDSATDTYFVVYRSEHPIFGNSVDLPGGTVEKGESDIEATIREVYEEAAISVNPEDLTLLYSGREYSRFNTKYILYFTEVPERPAVTLSWEHSRYDWLSKDDVIKECRSTKDNFMRLAADCLEKL